MVIFMQLEVKTIGNDILRKKAEKVEKPFDKYKPFIINMIDTMYLENGIGLAAPQAGRSLRIFIYDISDEENPVICINPEISELSEEMECGEEGCLSIPDINGSVNRHHSLVLKAFGIDGFRFRVEAEGLEARVIQHEFDHLNGILFVDHIPEDEKNKISKKIEKIEMKNKS